MRLFGRQPNPEIPAMAFEPTLPPASDERMCSRFNASTQPPERLNITPPFPNSTLQPQRIRPIPIEIALFEYLLTCVTKLDESLPGEKGSNCYNSPAQILSSRRWIDDMDGSIDQVLYTLNDTSMFRLAVCNNTS